MCLLCEPYDEATDPTAHYLPTIPKQEEPMPLPVTDLRAIPAQLAAEYEAEPLDRARKAVRANHANIVPHAFRAMVDQFGYRRARRAWEQACDELEAEQT